MLLFFLCQHNTHNLLFRYTLPVPSWTASEDGYTVIKGWTWLAIKGKLWRLNDA